MNDNAYVNEFNNLWATHGINEYENYFDKLYGNDLERALFLINHENLDFGALFFLKSKINEYNLYNSMSERNKITLSLINEFTGGFRSSINFNNMTISFIENVHLALKWMFNTGAKHDGLSNELDEVLDKTAILLIKIFKDKSILKDLIDLIFKRYEKGFFIQDLVWAFFESRDIDSLILIASRLKSDNKKDIEFVCNFLDLAPSININNKAQLDKNYMILINWIYENHLFLYYCSENLKHVGSKLPYRVALDAKYIGKKVDVDTGKIKEKISNYEFNLLSQFNRLNVKEKTILSNYSYRLNRANIYAWNNWLTYPISEQLRIAYLGGMS